MIWNGQRRPDHLLPERDALRPAEPGRLDERRHAAATPPTRSPTSVTSHEAWGLGSYCFFNVDPTVVAASGFEVPNNPGVKFHHALTVSLGGKGSITNVINTTGGVAQGEETIPSKVVSYP